MARPKRQYKAVFAAKQMELTLYHHTQEPRLAIIHIPLDYYSFFLQPLLRLLFGEDYDEDTAKIFWTNRHEFLNISITPIECSVICSRELADRFFKPLAEVFNQLVGSGKSMGQNGKLVQISSEDYVVIQVDGQGLDAGQRVLELTSPLAMAGISIFFLTTYFSDYILVPRSAHRTVTTALEQRGFVFSKSADAFVSQLAPSSPTQPHHTRNQSSDSPPPTTPPAKDIPELQTRTFERLKKNNVKPTVDRAICLLNCAGSKEIDASRDSQLKNDLMQVLLSTCPAAQAPAKHAPTGLAISHDESPTNPDFSTTFLSLTLTSTEPISVLLESRLTESLGSSLLGSKAGPEDVLIPITLDLREFPMQATGIVCGVAGRLAQGAPAVSNGEALSPKREKGEKEEEAPEQAIEISFLSTARAGTVIVRASELERAVGALEAVSEVVMS